jgi:helicase required for RNAi-mediated heterochromatin assembly 1
MTTKEMAIVQGPPGTGKTFTSVVTVESLIKAFGRNRERTPIIVSAQTNHALDQLLTECMRNGALVVRLGGSSQDEEINQQTIYNLRQNSKAARPNRQAKKSQNDVYHKFEELLNTCFPEGLISAETFFAKGILSQEHYESLKNDEWETMDNTQGDDTPTQNLIDHWLADNIEQDQTFVYLPPAGQAEPSGGASEGAPEMDPEAAVVRDDRRKFADDERDRFLGKFIPVRIHLTGAVASRGSRWVTKAAQILGDQADLYQVKPEHRGQIYRYMRQQLIDKVTEGLPKLIREYQRACDDLKTIRDVNDVAVIKHERIQIVGCTTTGLTKYRGLLSALEPKVLMVEEAAETREANITSALFPTLDQLILVGDHQQLVPHVDVRELKSQPHNLDVSLFERLVTGSRLPYCQLQVQRRMIPAIRQVVQTFYPNLRDHAIVRDPRHRPPVPGTNHNMWWFQHDWPDARSSPSFSFINTEEAKMIVGFAQYLAQNGTEPSQITVLTFYSAQVDLIVSLLRSNSWFKAHHPDHPWTDVVRTVDGFQGEQNAVILLSVVRSCIIRPNAGFVANENRAAVSLSRAMRGLFVFGNDRNLLESSDESRKTWEKVCKVFRDARGRTLPLQCKNHGVRTEIREAEDWARISGGGCQQACGQTCSNGHPCDLPCHPVAQSQLRCQQACEKVLPCGHDCRSCCGEACKCPHRCDEPRLSKTATDAPPQGPRTRSARGERGFPVRRAIASRNAAYNRPRTVVPAAPSLPHPALSRTTLPSSSTQLNVAGRTAGEEQAVSYQGTPVIRETFRQTSATLQGRAVEGVSHHEHASVAEEEEDLIDLRDEVPVTLSPGRQKAAATELLIDFDE